MKLNRTTYEIYLIDYLDGKLDAVEVSELLLFLEQNPDLKEEFDGLNEISLVKETVNFDATALIKPAYNTIGKDYETLLVAQLEGDISPDQQKELNRALTLYPELKKDAELFAQTRLQPDLTLIFKNKSRLKVFAIQPYYKTIIRVAAVLLLVSFAGIYFSKKGQQSDRMASTQPVLTIEPGGKSPVENSSIEKPGKENVAAIPPTQPVSEKYNQPVRKQDAALPEQELITQQQKSEVVLIQPNYKTGQVIALHDMISPAPVAAKIERPELPATVVSRQEFVDVKTWVARKFKKETNLRNEEGFLARINKATHAEVVIEKDTTGKITRFEIAGIGLVSK